MISVSELTVSQLREENKRLSESLREMRGIVALLVERAGGEVKLSDFAIATRNFDPTIVVWRSDQHLHIRTRPETAEPQG